MGVRWGEAKAENLIPNRQEKETAQKRCKMGLEKAYSKSSVAAVNGVGNRGVCHATDAQPGRGEGGEYRTTKRVCGERPFLYPASRTRESPENKTRRES